MTITEFVNANKGFGEVRKEDFQHRVYCARIVSFWAYKVAAGKKLRKYEQLFEMEADIIARRERLKNVKPVEIIYG